jgi:hypothetical protein
MFWRGVSEVQSNLRSAPSPVMHAKARIQQGFAENIESRLRRTTCRSSWGNPVRGRADALGLLLFTS